MWTSKQVERALFGWDDWKQSIVRQWTEIDVELETYSLGQLRNLAIDHLRILGLEPMLQFQIYWLSCIASDYCLTDPQSFENICVPPWLHTRFQKVVELAISSPEDNGLLSFKINSRILPPQADIAAAVIPYVYFEEVQRGIFSISFADNDKEVVRWWEKGPYFTLHSKHELAGILKGHKGKPREKRAKQGKPAQYSGRIAVKCAVLSDSTQMTTVQIARKYHLKVSRPYLSNRSDITRHLISRGRNLLKSLGIFIDSQKRDP